jgi:hypothetical protein
MQHQWHQPPLIEVLYLHIKDGITFTTADHDPPTKPIVLYWAYNNVEKCGHFDLACHEWGQLDISEKMGPFQDQSQCSR